MRQPTSGEHHLLGEEVSSLHRLPRRLGAKRVAKALAPLETPIFILALLVLLALGIRHAHADRHARLRTYCEQGR